MEIKKYAAIDIGSNAIRLLIANVIISKNQAPIYKKSSLVRVPIRLGADSFFKNKISEQNQLRLIDAMNAFRLLMNVHGVQKYKACATSAMREASNGKDIVALIKSKTSIDIEIIDGKREASIIFASDLSHIIDQEKTYLYIDVGGGSTEFTIFSKGKIKNSKSFKIGTVRKKNKKEMFNQMQDWILKYTAIYRKIDCIGSGGNINKIHKISGKTNDKPLSYIYLNANYHFYKKISFEDRVKELGLNTDRADVIIPALKIYLSAMKWSKSKKIYVPKVGLSDGIIKLLHESDAY